MQIAPLYELLKDTENIEFTPTMTDPEPTFVPALHADDEEEFGGHGMSAGNRSPGGTADGKWTQSRGRGFRDEVIVSFFYSKIYFYNYFSSRVFLANFFDNLYVFIDCYRRIMVKHFFVK